jgi:N-methylhydantoinase B
MPDVQAPIEAVVTSDGIIRNPQATQRAIESDTWDGRRGSYIPVEPLRIDPSLELHRESDLDIDPITYQVLRSRFWHKNLEHGDVIQRVSGSAPVVYSRDYATAICTEEGDVVVVSPTIQFFSALADLIVKWTLEYRSAAPGIRDGDVFLQNDPYIGAAQQSDTSFYAPVFWDGRLFCWVFNTLHVGDIGGVDAGGWAVNARDFFDESVAMPPVKIAEQGTVRWDIVDTFVRASREPDSILLNVKSALAGLRAIREQMLEMLEAYGPAVVKGVMRKAIADTSRVVSERLRRIPDGTWSERLYVTGLMPGEGTTHQEVLTLSKRGDQVVCSNAGTSPQGGAGNSTYGFLRAAVVGALGTALAWDQLGCAAGVANHVVFDPEPGTRNVARWPAAVSAHQSTFITLDLAATVTSKMLLSAPEDLRKRAYAGGGLSLPLGDVVLGFDELGRLVATPGSAGQALLGGCLGAFPFRDGIDSGGSWWMVGSSAGNVEESEEAGIALVLFRSENPDSGAPGLWRGGNSLAVGWTPHKVAMAVAAMIWADPSANPVLSLAGGYPGLGGNFLRLDSDKVGELIKGGVLPGSRAQIEQQAGPLARLHPKAAVPLPPGDCVVVEFNGSAGYGDPLARDPELVARDVHDGKVGRDAALRHYGVALGADGTVDGRATEARRAAIRAERLDDAAAFGDGGRLGTVARHAVVLRGAAGGVDVAEHDGARVWACSACGENLGPMTENFKLHTRYRQRPPQVVDERLYPDPTEFSETQLLLRQYACPGCATLLAQEFCLAGDEPWHDFGLILGRSSDQAGENVGRASVLEPARDLG